MKVIVFGANGHMGRYVLDAVGAGYAGSELAAAVSPHTVPDAAAKGYASLKDFTGDADVVVDFSSHTAVGELLAYCKERKLPAVIATTGFTPEETDAIRAASAEIPVFLSANMSVGVAVVAELARKTAAAFPNADIEIVETHHNRKKDVPSGTALMLAHAIQEERTNSTLLIGRHENGKRTAEEIGIHSIRLGNEVGRHEIHFATGSETVTIIHQAGTRALFAEGSLTAAAFLCGKGPGLYSMRDMLAE